MHARLKVSGCFPQMHTGLSIVVGYFDYYIRSRLPFYFPKVRIWMIGIPRLTHHPGNQYHVWHFNNGRRYPVHPSFITRRSKAYNPFLLSAIGYWHNLLIHLRFDSPACEVILFLISHDVPMLNWSRRFLFSNLIQNYAENAGLSSASV